MVSAGTAVDLNQMMDCGQHLGDADAYRHDQRKL